MSLPSVQSADGEGVRDPGEGLRFLWLELTNRCNLACMHCYADSSPHPTRADILNESDFLRLLNEASALGCRAVQFIGGEPTLHPALPRLIGEARNLDYEHIEVYTNATHLPESLLDCFVQHHVAIAVSVYGDEADIHDAVTTRRGSHRRTMANLRRLVEAKLPVRAGVIAMDANRHRIDETLRFLRALGIEHIGVDHARGVGRGTDVSGGQIGLQALCGACWRGSLCIAPDGAASACIMSKAWAVGSVSESPLADLVAGEALRTVRQRIRNDVWAPRQAARQQPSLCEPDKPCGPCDPLCPPCMPLCEPTCPPGREPCSPDKTAWVAASAFCEPAPCNPDGCTPDLVCRPSDPPCTPDDPWCSPKQSPPTGATPVDM